MAAKPTEIVSLRRDGTSQAARANPDLDPANLGIDERSTRDLLAFTRTQATQLLYYDEQNIPSGTWAGFFADVSDDDIIAFLDRPEDFAEDRNRALRRPHFVLFLTWLQLLGIGRDAINGLTRRHLEFYFRDVLRLAPRPAVPDRVFVLFGLAVGVDTTAIAQGTLLAAGRDAAGNNRFYSTERALIVNRAKVARLSSVFTDKRIIGMAEARTASVGTKEERFLAMLQLALGDPSPGDPLAPFAGKPVDYPRLLGFADLVAFAPSALWLQLFELRQLVARKRTRDHADPDWRMINAILTKAARSRRHDEAWTFAPANPRDFAANLSTALGGTPDFAGLPEVRTVDDLYAQRYRQDVRDAIAAKLFLSVDDFVAMMDLKRAADTDWRIVNSLLEQAGQRKRNDQTYRLVPADPADFVANMNAAIGPVDFTRADVADIDGYADAIAALEQYVFMSAEQFGVVMAAAKQPEALVPARSWNTIYDYLAQAHRQKVFAGRRAALRQVRVAAKTDAEGFHAILVMALGETTGAPADALIDGLAGLANADEIATLRTVAGQTAVQGAVTVAQWEQTYDILERAQRNREQFPDPLARREEWLNLYAQADATAVRVGAAKARDGEPVRWKTFGAAPTAPTPSMPPPRILGLAIASPLFALSAGERQLVLTLAFYDDGGGPLLLPGETPFAVEVSTAKGWIEPAIVELGAADYAKLTDIAAVPTGTKLLGLSLRLTLHADAAPIDAPPPDQRFDDCPWPVTRITLRPIWSADENRFVIRYARLRTLRLARVHLRSAVGSYVEPDLRADAPSLTPLVLENDDGGLDGKRPFEPFGAAPAAGAALAFGHPDLLHKSLRSLRLRLAWMGGPADLDTLYAAYGLTSPFSVTISQVDDHVHVTLLAANAPLFTVDPATRKQDATAPHVIDIPTIAGAWQPYTLPDPAPLDPLVTAWPRYLRAELAPIGFQHQEYPALVSRKTLGLAASIANLAAGKSTASIDPAAYAVGQPYTPKLKSLSLDFVAAHELLMESYLPGPTSDQIFHLHPFGQAEAVVTAPGQGFPFLPAYDNEGELYIGIADLRPPQSLAVLFQMAEGSANPDVARSPVIWSFLDAGGWQPLGSEAILQEGTRGLINSGIIEFALPPATPDRRLPAGLFWLRASVESGAAGVCDAVALHTQATSACYVDSGGAPDHYRSPLAAFSITALAAPLPGVASVSQPYTSFGARMAEEASSFYTAASERLRHKQRAVTLWDYERLVLRRFPEVYKVKCLPATLADGPASGADGGLGAVRVVVIPDIRSRSLFDPFEPKAPASLLADIDAYLAPLIPDTAWLQVGNAAYVQVRVRVGVRFVDQSNPGYNKQRLNDELNRYLSPWAYDEGADIVIGRRIYANSLVNFIDERPYVDYVAGIKLFWSDDGETFHLAPSGGDEGDYVSSDRADAVLVAARQHEIDLIVDEIYKQDEFRGLNYMKIELDFAVE
ncbi:MAG TPA: hypothetical protein VHS58_15630 [Acetobacteraceae bacterium]|nr:hypothetical protein [Acetobacteraceae bacterium]